MVALVVAGVVASGAQAHADPESFNPNAFDLGVIDQPVAPVGHALELAVGGGYTQGVGGAGSIGAVEDLTGPGGNVEVQIGARVSPRVALGAYGTLARYRHGDAMADGSEAYGATAGVQATFHLRPARSVDPWISVGSGVRGLRVTQRGSDASTAYGLELARAQLGVDYRVSPGLAVAPVIGASASVFLAEDTAMPSDATAIHDDRLSVYVFSGLVGRFDL